jgi:5-enolpyruvylshikimate-3-phosphate synthase
MVLALMTASLGADSPVEIDDTACVSKSFPEFGKVFARLTGKE